MLGEKTNDNKCCKRWHCTHTHTQGNLINIVGASLVLALGIIYIDDG